MARRITSPTPGSRVVAQTPRRSTNREIVHLTPDEHRARGKAARVAVPRASHAVWEPFDGRPNPVDLLEEQAATRVPELVPIRYGRMLVSPFTFYRGGAYIMASDLARTPVSGLNVQLCGDAHLSNFGGFASAERRMVFDINDFDETLPGPWEWDVKRLAASFEIAGRDRGFSAKKRRSGVMAVARSYREAMASFAEMRDLDVWYSRLDIEAILPELQRQVSAKRGAQVANNVAKAHTKDSMKAFAKLTHIVDGEPKIVSTPPLIVPISELLPELEAREFEKSIRTILRRYRTSLQNDRRVLVERFRFADLARKVVGVGSVGTRAWIVLMLGRDDEDPLFLQVKEASASVLEPFVGASAFKNHGQRVVEGQRLMQASSDIFLGWVHVTGVDGVERDFYVRQLWDWKISAQIETFDPSMLVAYSGVCGWTLARAHARSGDRAAIAAYLGSGTAFDEAIGDFSAAYADQNEADYAIFKASVESGRLEAQTGL
ncbi:MAG: DUF2252 domain-containing protein [Coriobacteriia bacterium]|nr:DUF2252 domain-containing protein [Coriobacteriia bacterium]